MVSLGDLPALQDQNRVGEVQCFGPTVLLLKTTEPFSVRRPKATVAPQNCLSCSLAGNPASGSWVAGWVVFRINKHIYETQTNHTCTVGQKNVPLGFVTWRGGQHENTMQFLSPKYDNENRFRFTDHSELLNDPPPEQCLVRNGSLLDTWKWGRDFWMHAWYQKGQQRSHFSLRKTFLRIRHLSQWSAVQSSRLEWSYFLWSLLPSFRLSERIAVQTRKANNEIPCGKPFEGLARLSVWPHKSLSYQ